jgi:hypothetical protein
LRKKLYSNKKMIILQYAKSGHPLDAPEVCCLRPSQEPKSAGTSATLYHSGYADFFLDKTDIPNLA